MYLKTSNLTKSSIIVALIVVLLYFSKVIPGILTTVLILNSSIIGFTVLNMGYKEGIMIFIVSSLLFLILGFSEDALLYVLMFGPYPVLKLFIEKLKLHRFMKIILKTIFFIVVFSIGFVVYVYLLFPSLKNYNLPMVLLITSLGFYMYDYLLSSTIVYISKILS